MTSDRFFESVRSVVHRVLNDRARVDLRAWYPVTVESQDQGTGDVSVSFDDDALRGISGVKWVPAPGHSPRVAPGTRAVLTWLGGDELYPRAFALWDGAGSLTSEQVDATARISLVAPLVELGASPAAAAVMLASAVPALNTMLGTQQAMFTALATLATALGVAVPALAVPAAALASAATAAATATGTYTSGSSQFIATKVRAT